MSAEVHADGAPPPAHWRERRKQLESDLRLLQQDTLALSKAFEAASADLVSQEDCQECASALIVWLSWSPYALI